MKKLIEYLDYTVMMAELATDPKDVLVFKHQAFGAIAYHNMTNAHKPKEFQKIEKKWNEEYYPFFDELYLKKCE